MKQRIAIPTANKMLCSHFGHCEAFYMADIEDNKIINDSYITPPAHEPGLYPKWVKENGATLVIAGGMGQKAQDLFAQNQLSVMVGAPILSPTDLINSYLKGELKLAANHCDH